MTEKIGQGIVDFGISANAENLNTSFLQIRTMVAIYENKK